GYASRIERVLVPAVPQLLPVLASQVVEAIARAKATQNQIFDVTSFEADEAEGVMQPQPVAAAVETIHAMDESHSFKHVEVVRQRVDIRHTLRLVLDASKNYDVVAIGSAPIAHRSTIAFGRLQDAIIQRAQTDVLLTCAQREVLHLGGVKRILVPTNGQEYSFAAGDIAAYLARACGAELVLFHMVTMEMDALFWREHDFERVKQIGRTVVDELAFRCRRLDVPATGRVEPGTQPGDAILRELERTPCDLIVLGGYNRGTSGRPYLGGAIRAVLARSSVPAVVLVSRIETARA
ncbi:MAG: universal stress protein, partial [Ktedonobacterales bacterium]